MRHAMVGFGRGVWQAPWMGPNGETILVAVNRDRRQVGAEIMIPLGGAHHAASDELWARLERDDPLPIMKLV